MCVLLLHVPAENMQERVTVSYDNECHGVHMKHYTSVVIIALYVHVGSMISHVSVWHSFPCLEPAVEY